MKRDIYQELISWKNGEFRKPLILRGARQVGKTYILKEFAKSEYENCIYINFEKQSSLFELFDKDLDPERIVTSLSSYFETTISPDKTLIIFDEIQECSNALNSLKYFCEEANQYHVAAAGSLLGVKLSKSKGFPVGKVNFLDLKPLSFFEFLTATGKNRLRAMLESLHSIEPISAPIHTKLIDLLKLYCFIGGMPEAIKNHINGKSLVDIRAVHNAILDAYVADFVKHADKNQVMKIMAVWDSIPNQLAKENKKFIFSVIRKSARGREYKTAIQWLVDAGLIYKAHKISAPKIPLKAYADHNSFKIFMFDVGLLGAMSDLPTKLVTTKNGLFAEFKGALTENYVAQELMINSQAALYYWSDTLFEIDFIVPKELHVLPLEIKSGISKHRKSLIKYGEKFHPKILLRASPKNLIQSGKIRNIPLYLVMLMMQLTNPNSD